jgi:iron complex outermembrane recepter protein
MIRTGLNLSVAGGALAMVLAAPAAHAEAAATTAAEPSTPEIVVTAQKRSENVQQVPISVTVISADQLARRGVQGIQDLSQASAGLEFTAPSAAPGGGGFVRGIGTNQNNGATVASSVSIVLDGVVLGNANVTDLFDTDRVEVLKGPQGTLFGSSVSSGVINVTTKAPKIGETSGMIGGEVTLSDLGSEYSRKVLRGAINLPVSDESALRIAFQTYNNVGMTHDVFTGQDENASSYAVRVRYLAHFGDKVTFNLIGDYDRMLDDNISVLTYRAVTAGSPLAQALTACGVTPGPDNIDSCQSTPTFYHTSVGGLSGQFDVELDGMTLTSVTSWRERFTSNANNIIGIDPATAGTYMTNCLTTASAYGCSPVRDLLTGSGTDPQTVRNNLFTQELRLSSDANHHFEWVAGLYFQRTTYFANQPGELDIDLSSVGGPSNLAAFTWADPAISSAHTADYAAFANGTFFLGEGTRLIGGLRYTHSTVWETTVNQPNDGSYDWFTNSAKADAVTWRVGVQQDFGRATMVYGTISTGYKAPEINDALTATNIAAATYSAMNVLKPERPTNFEVGIKQSLFHNKLYVDADVFYTDVKNYQAQSVTPGPSGLVNTNVSVPSIKTKGVEWEVFGHPFQGTTINLSGIYNDAKYPNGFLGSDGGDLSGQQIAYAPKFKMSVSAEQEVPLSARYALVIGGDATIRSSQRMYMSADPEYIVPSTTLYNARISLKSNANWTLSLFGRNLGNKVYPTQLYPTAAFAAGGLWQVIDGNSRRTVGLQFEAKF